jgi:hypothetical protein
MFKINTNFIQFPFGFFWWGEGNETRSTIIYRYKKFFFISIGTIKS